VGTDGAVTVAVDKERFAIRLGNPGDGRLVAHINQKSITVLHSCENNRAGFVKGARSVSLSIAPYLSGKLLSSGDSASGEVLAPMMGQISAVEVVEGQAVNIGDRLGIMESMKMELTLSATVAGTIVSVGCAAGDTVERDQVLFGIASDSEEAAA
jgi:biotin carboxyl carrier protein